MKKSTIACKISPEVALAVKRRDYDVCIVCGCQPTQLAHYISRARLGLGIEQNIVCLCPDCHFDYDNGKDIERRDYIKKAIEEHLGAKYPHWDKTQLTYTKENDK